MKADVVLAGVGGQGVLTVAAILAEAARRDGLEVKQSEVHGMSQRGGAVFAGVRMADRPIESDLIPRGSADLLLSLEPLEALRHAEYLSPGGRLVTASDPVDNIPDYPDLGALHRMLGAVPGVVLVDADALAKKAGSLRSSNIVMVGAATAFLPVRFETVAACIAAGFSHKGERVAEVNAKAFEEGRAAVAAAPR